MRERPFSERFEEGDRVLDIGTKDGRRLANVNTDIVGIDVKLTPKVDAIQYVYADGGHLPFATDSFDAIVCNHVLEHVPHKAHVVSEMSRVLKPDGECYVAFPNRLFPDTLFSIDRILNAESFETQKPID